MSLSKSVPKKQCIFNKNNDLSLIMNFGKFLKGMTTRDISQFGFLTFFPDDRYDSKDKLLSHISFEDLHPHMKKVNAI